MKKQVLYILWDEKDGYMHDKMYLDEESANIGLFENYTEYWIQTGKAKVMPIMAVSYLKRD